MNIYTMMSKVCFRILFLRNVCHSLWSVPGRNFAQLHPTNLQNVWIINLHISRTVNINIKYQMLQTWKFNLEFIYTKGEMSLQNLLSCRGLDSSWVTLNTKRLMYSVEIRWHCSSNITMYTCHLHYCPVITGREIIAIFKLCVQFW